MSEVQLVVREAGKDWSGSIHGSDADRAIAALSADPVTLEELKAAFVRFTEKEARETILWNLRPGLRDEPYDAGLVILDLVARLVVVDSTYSSPGPDGEIWPRGQKSEYPHFYHLADDWLFLQDALSWEGVAEARRQERAANPPQDFREVLFGRPLLEFLARETLTAFQNGKDRDLDPLDQQHLFKTIHAAWLLTPRDDLRGRSPREVMMERRKHIGWELQDRCLQWSDQGKCPAGLAEESVAFRYGGFGIHEMVIYYGLIRELLLSTWSRLQESAVAEDFLVSEAARLEGVREQWLDTPNREFHGRTPRSIIRLERRRIPEVMSGKEAMHDPDCPCCQMLADSHTPMFWHLDGSSMEDEFAFDLFHRTLEEWEKKQREMEEFNIRFAAEWEERKRLGTTSPWTSSYIAEDTEMPLEVRLFGISGHLAELIDNLRGEANDEKSSQSAQHLIDQLNRHFGNLRELLDEPFDLDTLFEPVRDSLVDTLAEVETAHPHLAPKCDALADEVKKLLT